MPHHELGVQHHGHHGGGHHIGHRLSASDVVRMSRHAGGHLLKWAEKHYKAQKRKPKDPFAGSAELAKGDDLHGGITSSHYKAHSGLKLHKDVQKGPGIHLDEIFGYMVSNGLTTNAGAVSTNSGQQVMKTLCEIGTYSQAYAGVAGAPADLHTNFPPDLSNARYLDLIPTTLLQNSTYYSTQTESSLERIVLRNVSLNIEMFNDSNAAVTVDVYLLKAKTDIDRFSAAGPTFTPRYAEDVWYNSNQLTGNHAAQVFFLSTGPVVPVVGGESIFQPFSKPSEALEFNKKYKIVKVHRASLAAAAVDSIQFSLTLNKVFDYAKDGFKLLGPSYSSPNQVASNDNTLRYGLARGGFSVMVVQRGQPVRDSNSSAGGTNVVTLAATNVGYVVSKKSHLLLMKQNVKKFTTVQAYDYLIADTASANQKLMNITDTADNTKSS